MDASEIKNPETLKAWLETQPQSCSIAIANRCAMRATPFLFFHSNPLGSKDSVSSRIIGLWGLVLGAVAFKALNRELAEICELAVLLLADLEGEAPRAVAYSLLTTRYKNTAAEYANTAISSALSEIDEFDFRLQMRGTPVELGAGPNFKDWYAICSDAIALQSGTDPFTLPLWHNQTPPDWFTTGSSGMRTYWQINTPTHWDFWQRWYDAAIAGRPLDWQLQHDIALIPDDIWQSGPGPVAEAIAKIEAAHEIDRKIKENPYAWKISFDRTTQTFSALPVEPRDLSEIVAAVAESIRFLHRRCTAMKQGNFGESVRYAFAPVVSDLKADLKAHATSPLSLFKSVEAARKEFEAIAHTERYGNESFLVRFFGDLASHAEDICVAAPEVVAQLKAKEAVRYELYSAAQKQAALQFTLGLHADAEGILRQVALQSLRIIQDDKSSEADKREAWYFAKAVLPRAARAYMVETDTSDDPAPPATAKSKLQRIKDVADTLSSADKGIDAIQENAPELLDWVTKLIESYAGSGGPIP